MCFCSVWRESPTISQNFWEVLKVSSRFICIFAYQESICTNNLQKWASDSSCQMLVSTLQCCDEGMMLTNRVIMVVLRELEVATWNSPRDHLYYLFVYCPWCFILYIKLIHIMVKHLDFYKFLKMKWIFINYQSKFTFNFLKKHSYPLSFRKIRIVKPINISVLNRVWKCESFFLK